MITKKRVIKVIVWIMNLIVSVGICWFLLESLSNPSLGLGILLMILAPFLIIVMIFLLRGLQISLQEIWEARNSKTLQIGDNIVISCCLLLAPYGLYLLIPLRNMNLLVPLKISGIMLFCSLAIIFVSNFLISLIPLEQNLEKPKRKAKRDELIEN